MKRLLSIAALCALLVSLLTALPAAAAPWPAPEPDLVWPAARTFNHVWTMGRGTYNGREGQLYINDHTVIYDGEKWHLFGITGVDPAMLDQEDQLAHATAPTLAGPWTQLDDVLTNPDDYGEAHVWAPHVVKNGQTYYMFYAAGSKDHAEIKYATSTDLTNWVRRGVAFVDGAEARDPMVKWIDGQWVIYYTSTTTGTTGNFAVAYRTSPNLVKWRATGRSLTVTRRPAGSLSSPSRRSWCSRAAGGTCSSARAAVTSAPTSTAAAAPFSINDYAGHIMAHAAEVVQDGGSWWVTAAGWEQKGLYLAPLTWSPDPQLWQSAQNPTVAANADGRLEAFALEPGSNEVYHRWQTSPSGPWSAWEWFGTPAGAVPTVGRNSDGRLEVFARSPGGTAIFHHWQTSPNGAWSGWEPFGGPAAAAPTVGQNADGRLEVFALSPGGAGIYHRWQTSPSGAWSDWAQFGGPAGGPPPWDGTPTAGWRFSPSHRAAPPSPTATSSPRTARGATGTARSAPRRPAAHRRWRATPTAGWRSWRLDRRGVGCSTATRPCRAAGGARGRSSDSGRPAFPSMSRPLSTPWAIFFNIFAFN